MTVLRVIALAIMVTSLGMFHPVRASADCKWTQTEHMIDGAVQVTAQWSCAEARAGAGKMTSSASSSDAVRDSDWDAVCVRTAIAVGAAPDAFCDLPPAPAVPAQTVAVAPALTPGLIARAFRTLDLPPSELHIQPPNGRTLVNFETNFYTEQPAFDRTVRLLGRRVDLRIWPSGFRWVFGDGAEIGSESAGAPYPDLLITHNYRQKGGVSPRVDTTYAAEFSVDGGAWREVDGTVTIPGEPVPLEVVTARPVLVSAD